MSRESGPGLALVNEMPGRSPTGRKLRHGKFRKPVMGTTMCKFSNLALVSYNLVSSRAQLVPCPTLERSGCRQMCTNCLIWHLGIYLGMPNCWSNLQPLGMYLLGRFHGISSPLHVNYLPVITHNHGPALHKARM
jgi:hypothetical protein